MAAYPQAKGWSTRKWHGQPLPLLHPTPGPCQPPIDKLKRLFYYHYMLGRGLTHGLPLPISFGDLAQPATNTLEVPSPSGGRLGKLGWGVKSVDPATLNTAKPARHTHAPNTARRRQRDLLAAPCRSSIPSRHHAPLQRRNPPTHSSHQHHAAQRPLYTCVSYAPATTTRQIRHFPDTNHVFSATRVSNPPICVSTPTRPTTPSPNHDEIRQPLSTPANCPVLHMCQLRPSYGHATNATPLRYKSLFSRYERSSMFLSECRARPPKILGHTTTKYANPSQPPQPPAMQLISQLRPSYAHATNATPYRYETNCSRYEDCRTPLSERRARPPKDPRLTPRRNPPVHPRHSAG